MAYFIDGLVLIIPNFIIKFAIGVLLLSLALGSVVTSIITAIVGLLVSWAFFAFMTTKYQATLGKMAVGIKVISDKEGNLTKGQVILRETIGKLLSSIILSLGYITAAFTKKKQALHDMIAGTAVIYKEPNKKFGVGAIVAIIAASILPLLMVVGLVVWLILAGLIFAKNKAKTAQDNAANPSISAPTASQPAEDNTASNQQNTSATNNQNNNSPATNTFHDDSLGYSITYPQDWNYTKQTDPSNGDVKIFFSPISNNVAAGISIDKFEGINVSKPSFFPGFVGSLEKEITNLNGKISDEKDFIYKFDDGTAVTGKHFKGEFTQGSNTAKEWIIAIPS